MILASTLGTVCAQEEVKSPGQLAFSDKGKEKQATQYLGKPVALCICTVEGEAMHQESWELQLIQMLLFYSSLDKWIHTMKEGLDHQCPSSRNIPLRILPPFLSNLG